MNISALPGQPIIVSIAGELSLDNEQEHRKQIMKALSESAANLVFDFSQLEYIDSSGIGLLLHVKKTLLAKNHQMTLKAVQPTVLKILTMGSFHKIFTIEP